jgi:dolichol-phosphate mannosyltransferase
VVKKLSTRVLIILPTFNEALSIKQHLSTIDNLRKDLEPNYSISILQIDDSSPDGTAKIASDMNLANFSQLSNPKKLGLGPAYLAGFNWGIQRNFEYFVEMDSDGSHLPSQLLDLLAESSRHDLVIGTRWMPGGRIENWSPFRRILSRFGTIYAATLLRLPIKDLTSGYRVLSRNFIESLDLDSITNKGYGFQIEIALQAYVNGFSVGEVPITFVERSAGNSKMSAAIAFEALIFVTRTGFKRLASGIYRR